MSTLQPARQIITYGPLPLNFYHEKEAVRKGFRGWPEWYGIPGTIRFVKDWAAITRISFPLCLN